MNEYDAEPVFFCKQCGSLKILSFRCAQDYCGKCGSTRIGISSIYKWLEIYGREEGEDEQRAAREVSE